ncbi:unnamed protein product [Symbiodinium natans]|uniref:Uncharacterized protein n=1 Tax=Symbiodinium natans TaxID=878477 RepID=A0A812P6M5_9DINO|nr:unnamed protein product [Symbiodinium natans]
MGLVELQRASRCSGSSDAIEALRQAQEHFLRAIRTFRDQKVESIWSAVSFWDMYIVMQKLKSDEAAVPWLKKAIELQVRMQGSENGYTKLYQQRLADMLGVPFSAELADLSPEEKEEIERALDPLSPASVDQGMLRN